MLQIKKNTGSQCKLHLLRISIHHSFESFENYSLSVANFNQPGSDRIYVKGEEIVPEWRQNFNQSPCRRVGPAPFDF